MRNFAELPAPRSPRSPTSTPQKLATVNKRLPGGRARPPTGRSCSTIRSIDAIAIATPVARIAIALAALKAGKHVWLEKPMTETSDAGAAL